MNERQALLQAVLDDPDDDLVRLVFADWLQENGEEDFAEYIRVEIEWARLRACETADPQELRDVYERREKIVAGCPFPTKHLPTWLLGKGWFRSLETSLSCDADQWAADGVALTAHEPIHRLRISGWSSDPVLLMNSPANRRLSGLDLWDTGPEIVAALAGSKEFLRLRRLSICGERIIVGRDELRTLGQNDFCAQLDDLCLNFEYEPGALRDFLTEGRLQAVKTLSISRDEYPLEDLRAFARTKSLGRLDFVRLWAWNASGRDPREPGVEELFLSDNLAEVQELILHPGGVTDGVLACLARPNALKRIRKFHVHDNRITAVGVAALLGSRTLPTVETLSVSGSRLTHGWYPGLFARSGGGLRVKELMLNGFECHEEWLFELLESPAFADLRTFYYRTPLRRDLGVAVALSMRGRLRETLESIRLEGSRIENEGARLLAAVAWGRLSNLDVSRGSITGEGARALAGSPRFGSLRTLKLCGNPVGDSGLLALVKSRKLPALRELSLRGCGITDAGVAALVRSDGFRSLVALDLTDNRLNAESQRRLRLKFGPCLR